MHRALHSSLVRRTEARLRPRLSGTEHPAGCYRDQSGCGQTVDTSKVARVLGWKTRPAVTSVIDAGESLLRNGLIG